MKRPMTRFALAFMTVGVVTACAAEPPAEAPAEPPPAAVDSLPGGRRGRDHTVHLGTRLVQR